MYAVDLAISKYRPESFQIYNKKTSVNYITYYIVPLEVYPPKICQYLLR